MITSSELLVPIYRTVLIICESEADVLRREFPELDVPDEILAHTFIGFKRADKTYHIVVVNPMNERLTYGLIMDQANHLVRALLLESHKTYLKDDYMLEAVAGAIHKEIEKFTGKPF